MVSAECRGLKRQGRHTPSMRKNIKVCDECAVDYITQKVLNLCIYIYTYVSFWTPEIMILLKHIPPTPQKKVHTVIPQPNNSVKLKNPEKNQVQRCDWQRLATSWCDSNASATGEYGHGGGWTDASRAPTYAGAGQRWMGKVMDGWMDGWIGFRGFGVSGVWGLGFFEKKIEKSWQMIGIGTVFFLMILDYWVNTVLVNHIIVKIHA